MEDFEKLSFYPIENEDILKLFHDHQSTIWGPGLVQINDDLKGFRELPEDTKKYIKYLLCLFAQLDGIVTENCSRNFCSEIGDLCKEAKSFFMLQAYMEVVHNETYSQMITTFIENVDERNKALNSIKNIKSIGDIAKWALEWMDSSRPLAERIVAFSAIEGVIFSSAFAGIYYLKSNNYLTALTKANEWIARDEALHTAFGVAIYRNLVRRGKIESLSDERIIEIIRSAVDVNEKFTREAMECKLLGIDADSMMSYVHSTADFLCHQYCHRKIYNAVNLIEGITSAIGLANRSNFFETLSTEYNSGAASKIAPLTYPKVSTVESLFSRVQ